MGEYHITKKYTNKAQREIEERKLQHIRIPLEKDVEARSATTLLEDVHLIHQALPELNFDEISTTTTFLNHHFSAPIIIDAMTGGTKISGKINATLASGAEKVGVGMVVGSQRAGLKSKEAAESYAIARRNAPNAFLAANVGGAQLSKGLGVEECKQLVDMINANALIVHLNPLQEVVQPEGEPFYRGVLAKISELARGVGVPVIVKEVGSGISREVAVKLELEGVSAVNVSGLGGTSWAAVEQYRAEAEKADMKASLGNLFWDWGIPTAVSLIEVRKAVRIPIIVSGGLRNGLDMAKGLALGASLCAKALPFLKAATESEERLVSLLQKTIYEIKTAMFLTGAQNLEQLSKNRYVITGSLAEWIRSSQD